jgi:hypothetical protein
MPETGATFHAKYFNIPVTTLGGTKFVWVHKYRSGDVWKSEWGSKVYWDLLQFLKKKGSYKDYSHSYSDGFFTAHDHPCIQIYLEEKKLHGCFNGKGSPERFSKALQLIDYYLQRAEIKLSNVGWGRVVSLQEFADYYLGLDCNGFVGSYFASVFPESTIYPDTHCNDFDNQAKKGSKRFKLADIRPRDVLVREGGGGTRHVALIDAVTQIDDKSAFIQLVQSSGSRGGLGCTSEKLIWLRKPAEKKSDAGDVLSVEVNGYYKFNYVIGYPFTE